MTSYINQTVARQYVAELIAEAEGRRVRRDLRRARREARAARRAAGWRPGPSNDSLYAPGRIGVAGAC